MVALVLVTAAAVGLLTYQKVAELTLPGALERVDTHARLLSVELEASLRAARADAAGFRAALGVKDIMMASLRGRTDPSAAASETEARRRIAARFVAELEAKPDYSQFRIIGIADGGRELVRVDRMGPGGVIRVVRDGDLQRKGDRDYFKQAIALPPNAIYVSSIDLNREDGVSETPHVPTLRTAAPIYTPDGKAFGIVIINVDLRRSFARLLSLKSQDSKLYLVNDAGDYLLSPNPDRDFAFDFGKRFRIQDDFPVFANLLSSETTNPRIVTRHDGEQVGIGWKAVRLAGGPRVTVIETVPYDHLMAPAVAARDAALAGGTIAAICALILAVILARSLARPLVQMTRAFKGFSRGEAIDLPKSGGPEIAVLADTFSRMAAEVREKTTAIQKEIEERRRIFDTSPDLILVTDSRGHFTRVNPSSMPILGVRPEEMVGKPAADFVFADDLDATRGEMRMIRRGRIMRNFQTRYVHKSGRAVVLEWSGVWSEPAHQFYFVGRDMTEQRIVEEKFRLAVEASPSGLVMTDAGGSIVLVNAETERLFGYKRRELIGQRVDILVPVRLQGPHVQQRAGFTARPQARRMGEGRELFGLRKDGTEFPIEIGLNPIATQTGLLILSVIVDISERRRAEATLRDYAEREQLFIAAVESSNDAIITKALDGMITGWNQAAERLFGFTAKAAIGKRIDIIVPVELRDDVAGVLDKIRGGEKVEHQETVRAHKDGHRIDVSLSTSPIKSHSGKIIGAAMVARDITARKKAQEALHNSEQMARDIIAGALDAFVQTDETGKVVEWNPRAEEMFGWSRQEALGKELTDLYLLEDYRPHYRDIWSRLNAGDTAAFVGARKEIDAVRKDGRRIKVEASITALHRRDGYVTNGFIRDLTEKIAAEDQLRQAQKMESVGQLTGGIAHDFNNMLTVITGTIDILGEAVADKPQLAAIAKLISEAADRGAELTGHLLAFARRQPLQPREIDINALMAESEKLLRPALGEQVEISMRLEETAWPAMVDPTQLTSALLNLAVNARDAMPDGGKLTLETRNVVLDAAYAQANAEVQPGHYVMIAVTDSGAGIPEAIRQKVFEPFFTTKDTGKGTGLGLSMVYGFVKQSGGHIKVYSEVGHGTTFKIYLPRAGAQAEEIADTLPETLMEGGNETILVVEDDPLVRASVTAQLCGLGYTTLSAANAVEALAIVDSDAAFDLLFTDVIMPGKMNGPHLAKEIAKRRSQLKVLFTSGYTENAIIHHGRLDRGVLLLAKPYRKEDLARMLRRALAGPLPSRKRASAKGRIAS
ncbi:MAG: PAS domain S-box protein [Pseudolabrys sp.]